jgi:hypothetical protein
MTMDDVFPDGGQLVDVRHQIDVDPRVHAEAALAGQLEDNCERIEIVRLTGKGGCTRLDTVAEERVTSASNLDEQRIETRRARSVYHLRDRLATGQAGTLDPQRTDFVLTSGLPCPQRLNGASNDDKNEEPRRATTRTMKKRKQRALCQTARL